MIIRLCLPIYTYPPFISRKSTWPQNILEVSSDSLLPPLFRGDHAMKCSCKAENKMVKKSAFKQIYTIISLLFLLSLWPLFLGGIGCVKILLQMHPIFKTIPNFLLLSQYDIPLLNITSCYFWSTKDNIIAQKRKFSIKRFLQ